MLLQVFDPKGEPFEVRPDVARQLVIQHGWSLDPPAPPVEQPVVVEVVVNADPAP